MRHLTVTFVIFGATKQACEGTARGGISMRRLFSFAAFGFGFYYLWNNTDPTIELVAAGAMGFALLLEFIGAD
jgi:hypothetical protein